LPMSPGTIRVLGESIFGFDLSGVIALPSGTLRVTLGERTRGQLRIRRR